MQNERDTKAPVQSTNDNDSWLAKLGPGLVTGAADDDPSGIATYSQAGAQFGYGLLWTLVFTYPLMVAIQLISARIGRVTGPRMPGRRRWRRVHYNPPESPAELQG